MGRPPVVAIMGNSIFHGVFDLMFQAVILNDLADDVSFVSIPGSLSRPRPSSSLIQLCRVAGHPPTMLIKTTMPKPIRCAEDSMSVAARSLANQRSCFLRQTQEYMFE